MKKFIKSTLSLLLACLLLIPGGFVFAAEPVDFTDVDADDWFAPYVDYCSRYGLVNGMTATTFEPETSLSRAMFVTILCRSVKAEPSEGVAIPFTDVAESHWAKDAILWAFENEIVNGMTPTTFQPDGKITREQTCTILCRFADAMGYEMPEADGVMSFEDDSMISEYAYDAVYSCANAEIVNGITIDTFGPKQYATRAQACAILMRFFRYTTSRYTETEGEGGKILFEYADKFGVYAEGYEITDEEGNVIEYYYEEDGAWEKSVYTYEDGELVRDECTKSDGYSSTATYAYENGMMVESKFSDSDGYEVTETYAYNENGDPTEYTYRDSEGFEMTYTYTYDENGNLLEEKYNDSYGYEEVKTYTYDEEGNLLEYKCTDTDGFEESESYTYEGGVLTEYKYSNSYGYEITETNTYDEDGNLLEYKYSDTDGYELAETYTYDEGRPVSYVYVDSDGVEMKADYAYDENDVLKGIVATVGEDFTAEAVITSCTEDGRIEECKIDLNGESEISFSQKYEDGVLVSVLMAEKTAEAENSIFIEYDEMGELASVTMAGLDVEVVIDKAGFTGPMGMATEMTVKSGEVTYAVSIDYDNSTVKVDDGASIEIYDENSEETAAIMMVVYMMQMIGEEYVELTPDSILEILIG